MNRPGKLNAINDVMRTEIEAALREVERDHDLWVVIIKGNGACFSVGQDVSGSESSEVVTKDPRDRWYLSELWEWERRQISFFQYLFNSQRPHGSC